MSALENTQRWRMENPDRARRTNRNGAFRRTYGSSIEVYDNLFQAQGGRCLICDRHEDMIDHAFPLVIDHCHSTGRIRGLLCAPCNLAMGHFRDDPDLIQKAIEYLERPRDAT